MRLTFALALLTAVLLAPSASATAPVATASKSCAVGNSRGYGTTYVIKISASGTSCRAARSLIKAYHACRPGKSGKCGQREGLHLLREALRQEQDAVRARTSPAARAARPSSTPIRSSPSRTVRLVRPLLLAALALAMVPAAAPAAQTVHAGPLTGTVDDGVGVRVARAGAGVTAVHLTGPAGARTVSISFPARGGERLTGFGERSNAVDQRGREVLNYVADGPFLEADQAIAGVATPDWAEVDRDDATYYPIPWLLSSRGYGVLVDNDETSRFRLRATRDAWSVEVDARRARPARLRGPAPGRRAAALHRGDRPPAAPPAPWAFGPWFQTGQPNVIPLAEEARIIRTLRDADAPVSAAETQMHFLPCGAHRARPRVRARAHAQFHAAGLAQLAYFNPHAVRGLRARVRRGRRGRALLQRGADGRPFTFSGVRRRRGARRVHASSRWRSSTSPRPAPRDLYARLVRRGGRRRATTAGWRTSASARSPDVVPADGTASARIHNRYPRDYHCAVRASCAGSAVRWCASSAPAGRARRAARSTCGAATRRPSGASTGCARP